MPTLEQRTRIRALNDQLRTTTDPIGALMWNGSLVITSNLAARGNDFVDHAVAAMRRFSDFDADNDPNGEHDCAVLDVDGHSVIWKIDYIAPDMLHGSEEPWDAGKTRRVLTLMLGEMHMRLVLPTGPSETPRCSCRGVPGRLNPPSPATSSPGWQMHTR